MKGKSRLVLNVTARKQNMLVQDYKITRCSTVQLQVAKYQEVVLFTTHLYKKPHKCLHSKYGQNFRSFCDDRKQINIFSRFSQLYVQITVSMQLSTLFIVILIFLLNEQKVDNSFSVHKQFEFVHTFFCLFFLFYIY